RRQGSRGAWANRPDLRRSDDRHGARHARPVTTSARNRRKQGLQCGLFRSRPVGVSRRSRSCGAQVAEGRIEWKDMMKTVSTAKSHGGVQGIYSHSSDACACDMTFAVFVPPQAADGPCPVLWYLSGLTCTHQNVMDKGEYRRMAAELGLIVVCPDTSPRGDNV